MFVQVAWSKIGKPYNYAEYLCDSDSDITNLPTNEKGKCAIGSIAMVVDSKNVYVLNAQNEWMLLYNYSSGSDSGSSAGGGSSSADIEELKTYVDEQIGALGIDDVKATSEQAIAIAKGRATGYVFDTVIDMNIWLNDVKNTSELVLGDNFYIKDVDVPDYWWDGSSARQLETQKVDLSEYIKTVILTQDEYDALENPSEGVLYIIKEG